MARPVLPLSAFEPPPPPPAPRFGWLPAPGSWKFHLLLSAVAIFVPINQLDDPNTLVGQWGSAMTYKFVGTLRGLG